MSDLTPDDEALIRAARGGLGATPEDQARIKGKLFVQIGIATGVAGSAISTSTAASAGAAGAGAGTTVAAVAATSLTTKLFLAVIVIGAAGGGAVAFERSTHTQPAAPPAVTMALMTSAPPSVAPVENAAPVITEAPAIPATPPPTVVDTPNAPSLPVAPTTKSDPTLKPAVAHEAPSIVTSLPVTTSTNSTPAAPPVTAAASGPTTVDAEAALLRNADAALKQGHPDQALSLVDQHARQFPNGILSEERDAERVSVLCALGRTDEARAAGAAFLRARPKSPLASRVRASCGGN